MREEDWKKRFKDAVDTEYSYNLAKEMEQYRTNPVLGYRTAGSGAEYDTGEMLARRMKELGLENVHKDRVTVDSWVFEKAVMRYTDSEGVEHQFQLGAYQTEFHTDGFEEFDLVYLGKGTAASYAGRDVKGKLVLIDINQRDEWWINFPVYQAHLKGAAALIAVQEQGYGEIHEAALNAQDIAGPEDAPAFSMSRADAAVLKADLERREDKRRRDKKSGDKRRGEDGAEIGGKVEGRRAEPDGIRVLFDASSAVRRDRDTYNITGFIPGEEDSMILLSAHYDSYFSGFQDDNAAVAMMLGIAKALLDTGYRPRKTLCFCAMAAEEWGVVNSKYDWSTGAYEQVFTAHPEWQGRVVADLNFELPAHAHGSGDAVRCVYEYVDFMEEFLRGVEADPQAYPEGVEVLSPIQTWSDDFSMAIAGIPSMVNDFSAGDFMETHYHSQFDNENFYQEPVYRFHHEMYGALLLAFDRTALAPMNFARLFEAARASVDLETGADDCLEAGAGAGADLAELMLVLEKGVRAGEELYEAIRTVNRRYGQLLEWGEDAAATELARSCSALGRELLRIFRKEQDYFVRLNWHDDVLFPQQAAQENLRAIGNALESLARHDTAGALEAVYAIDNNRYAFLFEEEVYTYFTEYVLNQPADRLKWGAGRILHHQNLFGLVESLKAKNLRRDEDVEEERALLLKAQQEQLRCYKDDIRYMISSSAKIVEAINALCRKL